MATVFKLRSSVYGHEKDVRALSAVHFPDNSFVSGSRDVTARLWVPNETDVSFREAHVMSGHSNFVSSVCYIAPDEKYPHGMILTGSNDSTILAFVIDSPQPVFKLMGHSENVCALASGKFGTVLSGSWDKTAKVWLKEKCVMTLQGHEAAVWAVAIMPEQGLMLTGSADKSIKLWKAGKCEKTFSGHDDCVRGLAVLQAGEFLSCSNDATVRHWLTTGECIQVFYGHSNYVYCLSVLPNGQDFITGSEDRTVKVWRGGECVQTIPHPAQSVWAVCCLQNGDIATGASDGVIRVFTTVKERMALPEEQKALDDQVASSTIPTQIGDIKIDELPGPDALLEPGKKDGQSKMVKSGDKVELYHWDAAETQWKKIGDVTGSTGGSQQTSGKILYEGKEYDYVFDVDISEGQPSLKLPFNTAEDPWMAAQKFLHKHELDQMFLDQVANFIITNTKGVTLGQQQPQGADPFTGGSRYVPSSGLGQGSTSGGTDPFTGAGRYVPTYNDTSVPSTAQHGADPFTGKSSYQSGDAAAAVKNDYYPHKAYLTFDVTKPEQIIEKLKEINKEMEDKVPDSSLNELENLMTGKKETVEHFGVLEKLLSWPQAMIFPVLDVLRISIRFPQTNHYFCKTKNILNNILLPVISPDSPVNNLMLALRTICNMFVQPDGEDLNTANRDKVLPAVERCVGCSNKNIQIALATVLLNYAVYLQQSLDMEGISQCLQICIALLQNDSLNPEASFRTLVCLGTLISKDDCCLAVGQSLIQMGVLNKIHQLTSVAEPVKLSKCASLVEKQLM